MLAMEVNDDTGSLTPHGALRFFRNRASTGCSQRARRDLPSMAQRVQPGTSAGLPTARNRNEASRGKKMKPKQRQKRSGLGQPA